MLSNMNLVENARAINLWDSNAQAGHPSKGILQFVDGTFLHYAMPGHHDIWKPFDQLLACLMIRLGEVILH